jgi:ribonuclease HII
LDFNKGMSQPPNLAQEDKLKLQGYEFIAGIDEAGRGALAGPVVAGAVILPSANLPNWLELVRDSKELSPKKREFLFYLIRKDALAVGTGIIAPEVIDSINILKATELAMTQAVEKLRQQPQFLLIDRLILPRCSTPQMGITGGDKLCLSIACASIVAKVTRDHIMEELGQIYPDYGLAKHKGYGTKEHISRLLQLGPSQIHRLSFAPIRNATASPFTLPSRAPSLHHRQERSYEAI